MSEFIDSRLVDYKTALDEIEPIENQSDLVREARVQAVLLLNRFASSIESALARDEPRITEVACAFWSGCYALGLNCCEGISMSDRAASLGCERATISKGATTFARAANLPPSYHMKKAEATEKYRDARLDVVKRSQNGSDATL